MSTTKLSPTYIFALTLALCAAAIFLFFSMVVKPKKEQLALMRDDLAQKQITVQQYRQAVAKVPELEKRIGELEIDRAEFLRALPSTAEFAQIVNQMRANVAAAKGDLTSLTFNPIGMTGSTSTTTLPSGVQAIGINMAVDGTYDQIFRVLRSLETQNRFTTVNNVGLQMPKALSFDPKLTSALNLTVYTYDPAQATATPADGAAAGTAPGAPAAAPAAPAAGGAQ